MSETMTQSSEPAVMQTNEPGGPSLFLRVFAPGLVLGLVIGLFGGAFLMPIVQTRFGPQAVLDKPTAVGPRTGEGMPVEPPPIVDEAAPDAGKAAGEGEKAGASAPKL
jgi:hypothetical protein